MFIVSWVFDKLGYMPKVSVDTSWPFPGVQKEYKPHEFEQPVKNTAKKTVKSVKMPKATTRKPLKK